eukprot:2728652-Pleurochrysis_carterae.AAC.1
MLLQLMCMRLRLARTRFERRLTRSSLAQPLRHVLLERGHLLLRRTLELLALVQQRLHARGYLRLRHRAKRRLLPCLARCPDWRVRSRVHLWRLRSVLPVPVAPFARNLCDGFSAGVKTLRCARGGVRQLSGKCVALCLQGLDPSHELVMRI